MFNGGATRRAINKPKSKWSLRSTETACCLRRNRPWQAWDRRSAAQELHALAQRRTQNAKLAAQLGADRYRDGILNALDFRALDVALLQSEAAELAARQEWAAAHWDVMRLKGDLRAGQVVVR